jgi:hypothetical protein
MEWAEADMRSDFLKTRLLASVLPDETDGLRDCFVGFAAFDHVVHLPCPKRKDKQHRVVG